MKLDSTKVRQVQEWLIKGNMVHDIVRNIMSKWSLTEKEANEHINAALEIIKTNSGMGYKEAKALHIEMLKALYRVALEEKNIKAGQSVLKDIERLQDF